jgi:death on curing protein
VLAIHRDQIESFGGASGIRDEHALDSALAQPSETFEERMLHQTIPEQGAAYLFHLVQNHPFVDGNKRVGFAAMDAFLRINRYRLAMDNDEAYRMVMAVAASELGKEELLELLDEKATPI